MRTERAVGILPELGDICWFTLACANPGPSHKRDSVFPNPPPPPAKKLHSPISFDQRPDNMPDYPGLRLDLRYWRRLEFSGHPISRMSIHRNCDGATSDLIYVREVAMMIIMAVVLESLFR